MERNPKCLDERRVGRFYVPDAIRQNFPFSWLEIMKDMLVTRGEYLMVEGCIEYVAFHDRFEPTKNDTPPPNYDLVIEMHYRQEEEGKRPTSLTWVLEPHQVGRNSVAITSIRDYTMEERIENAKVSEMPETDE